MNMISIALFASALSGTFVQPSLAAEAATSRETILHSFSGRMDGKEPVAGLTNVNGVLYGTTQWGGTGSYDAYGTVFSMNPTTGAETVLHSFCSQEDCADGAFPSAALTAVQGILYGTTLGGGANFTDHSLGAGTLFSIDPSTGVETVRYSFSCGKRKCKEGGSPESPLLNDHGKLYGTTTYGGVGSSPHGTVFEFDTKTARAKLLYSFCSQQNCADGEQDDEGAAAGLTRLNGILYGTTAFGGGGLGQCEYGCGVVFSLDPSTRTEKVLHSFCNQQGCPDGAIPEAGLTVVNGMLYGTTESGGTGGVGTIFALDPNTGAETVLHSFACVRKKCSNGAEPNVPLLDFKGKLYGTTVRGGAIPGGTAFVFDPATGVEKRLYSFGGGSDGAEPYGGLMAMKSTLYGTTFAGGCGKHACGTVFSLKP